MKSFEELLTRPDLKGRVTLLSEMRDTMGFMLKVVGADPSDVHRRTSGTTPSTSSQQVVDDGQVRAFTGNDYIQDLAAGNIVACEAWSGDVIQLQFDNPDIKFVDARGGAVLWSDNMLVPNVAEHQANAEKLDRTTTTSPRSPRSSRRGSTTSVRSRAPSRRWRRSTPSLVDNPLIFPDDEMPRQTMRLHGARRPSADPSTKESAPMSQVAEVAGRPGPTRRAGRRPDGCGS